MAVLAATVLDAAQFQASAALKSDFEARNTEWGAIRAIKEDTSRGLISPSEIQSLKKSERQPVKTAVLNKYEATSAPADSCNPDGDRGESAFVPLTFQPFGFAVKHIPEEYGDNVIGAQEDLAFKMRMGFQKVFNDLDEAVLAFLEANKTGAAPTTRYFDTVLGNFDYTGDPKQIYAFLPTLMRLMDMSGDYYAVADTEYMAQLSLLLTMGGNNQQNLSRLLTGQFEHFFTNRMDKGTALHKLFAVQKGTTAIVDWRHPQYTEGARLHESDYWFAASDPIFGFQWEAHYKAKCEDVTSVVGTVVPPATIVEDIWYGLKVSLVQAYSSTNESTIVPVTINQPA